MVPLLASSMMALAVILERCLFWRRFRKSEDGATILSLVAAGHLAEATKMARASRHPVARVLLAGLEHPYSAPGMAMEAAHTGRITSPETVSAHARYHHYAGTSPGALGDHHRYDQLLWYRL